MGFGEGEGKPFFRKVLLPLPNSSRASLPADGGHAPLSHGVVAALKEPRPDGLVSGGYLLPYSRYRNVIICALVQCWFGVTVRAVGLMVNAPLSDAKSLTASNTESVN